MRSSLRKQLASTLTSLLSGRLSWRICQIPSAAYRGQAGGPFDDDLVAAGLGYVETEHRRIAALAAQTGTAAAQRAPSTFCATRHRTCTLTQLRQVMAGRSWWAPGTRPEDMDALDAGILGSSKLKTGHYAFWHFLAYSIPGVSWVMRRIGVPPGSHEAMNLDKPSRDGVPLCLRRCSRTHRA